MNTSNGIYTEPSSPVIAEHVIALTLSLARRIPQFARTMSSGEWRRTNEITDSMQSIAGKTMLVVGLGGIGTEVERRGAAVTGSVTLSY